MAKEIKIEQLESSDKTELLKVLRQAFKNAPLPKLARRPRIIRILVKTLQRLFGEKIGMRINLLFFGGLTSFPAYGIRKDGQLVCVAILSDSAEEPKLSTLSTIVLWPIGFLAALGFCVGRILRRRTALELEMTFKEMPEYWKERYLELQVFGTLPMYQKQGLGRAMLRFLCKKAEVEGYEGIRLSTTRDTPAFHFYIKEGFTVEQDLIIGSESIVLMRLILSPSPTAPNSA